uniref:Uncharacterized protein n=1 Tax=Opuntia streptacantha TaxID=393608 RepID=A0A7C8YEM9_OPUST
MKQSRIEAHIRMTALSNSIYKQLKCSYNVYVSRFKCIQIGKHVNDFVKAQIELHKTCKLGWFITINALTPILSEKATGPRKDTPSILKPYELIVHTSQRTSANSSLEAVLQEHHEQIPTQLNINAIKLSIAITMYMKNAYR